MPPSTSTSIIMNFRTGTPAGSPVTRSRGAWVMPRSQVIKIDPEAKGLYRAYEGQRYWLCCAACAPAFDADPAKYAAA